MTVTIKQSQVPTTATAFKEHDSCAFPESASRTPPLYGWHFVLPGGSATFVSLTATFQTAGAVTIPGPMGAFVQGGKGAVIYTATNDTLTNATAQIEGTTPQNDFVLSHTCIPLETSSPTPSSSASGTPSTSASATGTPSESISASSTGTPSESISASSTGTPSESGTPSTSVSATATASASESGSETPSAEVSGTVLSSSPTSSGSVSPTVLGVRQTRVGGAALPTTGSPLRPLVALGLLLLAAGIALLSSRPKGRYAR